MAVWLQVCPWSIQRTHLTFCRRQGKRAWVAALLAGTEKHHTYLTDHSRSAKAPLSLLFISPPAAQKVGPDACCFQQGRGPRRRIGNLVYVLYWLPFCLFLRPLPLPHFADCGQVEGRMESTAVRVAAWQACSLLQGTSSRPVTSRKAPSRVRAGGWGRAVTPVRGRWLPTAAASAASF